MIDLYALASAARLLVDADLKPVQTDRFQPTGFPDLGPAQYDRPDGKAMLLVESAQSMANRAEATCWDEASEDLVPALAGLPYVRVEIRDGERLVATTATLLEAHRLNSPYVLEGQAGGRTFKDTLSEAAAYAEGQPVDRRAFVRAVFRHDPGALLHGLFMSQLGDGRLRLARALSAFIEAEDARPAQSGGVKNDRVNPSGDTGKGFGNVPFPRTEFVASHIRAYFNLDLRQLRSYALTPEATRLLQLLALFKIRRVLDEGLRLRTACDLDVTQVRTEQPQGFALPTQADLAADLPAAIQACAAHFAEPRITRLVFQQTEASGKKSRKATRAAKDGDAEKSA